MWDGGYGKTVPGCVRLGVYSNLETKYKKTLITMLAEQKKIQRIFLDLAQVSAVVRVAHADCCPTRWP